MTSMAELAQRAVAAGRMGIDTEFMGEGRYRSQLCLVQVAVEQEDGSTRVEPRQPQRRGRTAGQLQCLASRHALGVRGRRRRVRAVRPVFKLFMELLLT